MLFITLFLYNLVFAQKQKEVSTVKDFLLALDDNTEIIINKGVLDITSTELIKYKDIIPHKNKNKIILDAMGLYLKNFNNLTIKGKNVTKLLSTYEYDDILNFESCESIFLENLIIVHEIAADVCEGQVLDFYNCSNVHIKNCELNGSGTYGLSAIKTNHIVVNSTKIYNNSETAIYLSENTSAYLDNSTIHDNNILYHLIYVRENAKIWISNTRFLNNYTENGALFSIDNSDSVLIECHNCTVSNSIENIPQSPEFVFYDSDFTMANYNVNSLEKEPSDNYIDYTTPAEKTQELVQAYETPVDYVEEVAIESNENKCYAVSDTDYRRMQENNVSEDEIDNYCYVARKKVHNAAFAVDYIQEDPNANIKADKILRLLEWEDQKDNETFYQLDNFFSFPLNKYWDKTNLTKDELEQEYIASRNILLAFQNSLRSITQISENLFEVVLNYCFMTTKNKKVQLVSSKLHFEFEYGKIKSIYPLGK